MKFWVKVYDLSIQLPPGLQLRTHYYRLLGRGILHDSGDDKGCFKEGQDFSDGVTMGTCHEKGYYLGDPSKFLLHNPLSPHHL